MSIQHLPASAAADAIYAALGEDGVVVVDRLVRPEVMDEVADELRPFTEATPLGPDDFSGRRTRRTGGLIARSPKCRELVMNPTVLGGVGKLLSHATSFQLHLTQVIAIGAGEPVPDDPSRPVGVRFLSVPARLRGSVQYDLGDDGFHRGKRRHPRDTRQQSL